MPLKVIRREEWDALPPKETKDEEPMQHPVKKVAYNFYTRVPRCHSLTECKVAMKKIQKYYMEEEQLNDIPFNFLVGDDCRVYEGRGWKIKPDKSLDFIRYYDTRLDIAFIGDFRVAVVSLEMFYKGLDIVKYGIEQNYVVKEYDLLGVGDPNMVAPMNKMIDDKCIMNFNYP